MESIASNGEDKIANHPKIIDQEQKIALLIRLVGRIDDRTKAIEARQQQIEDQLRHVIDNTNRIIALLMPSQEP